ncbi:ABC transporter substrate-binding protein [bacterium]|nr:ABC transporter substrate-binding protein [bacterium]
MKKLFTGLILVIGLLSACVPIQPAETHSPTATFSPNVADMAGRTVQHALGIQPLASTVNLPDAVPGIPAEALAGIQLFSSTQVNLESLAELQPDLIIGNRYFVEAAGYDTLSQLAPTVVLSNTLPLHAYVETASFFGLEESAQAEVDAHLANVAQATEELGEDRPTVSVATIYAGAAIGVWATGPTSAPQSLLDLGVTLRPDPAVLGNALAANGRAWLSLEQISLLDGDRLLLLQSSAIEGEDAAVEEIQNNAIWATLPAVQNEQVYVLNRLGYPGFTGQQQLLADLLALLQE